MLDPHARMDDPPLLKMFPCSKQLISRPAWADYAFRNVGTCMLIYLIAKNTPGRTYKIIVIFFWLWVAYTLDYLIIYNEPFMYVGKLPLSYSLFAGLFMLGVTLKTIFKHDNT